LTLVVKREKRGSQGQTGGNNYLYIQGFDDELEKAQVYFMVSSKEEKEI